MIDGGAGLDRSITVSGAGLERDLAIAAGRLETTGIRLPGGSHVALTSTELEVVVATGAWRHDIPTWRWHEVDHPTDDGPADPAIDDASWRLVPHLHPVFDSRTDRTSWFRTTVTLPAEFRDTPLEFVLGGFDDEDWSGYAAWLDGNELDRWSGDGRIREPHRIRIAPGSDTHRRLRFDEPLLLAVRATGLDRTSRIPIPGEREHYFFQDWLLDQYVAVEGATRTIRDFRVAAVREAAAAVEIELASEEAPGLAATVRYGGDRHGLRKHVVLRNRGDAPLTVLDVVGEDWRGELAARGGGRGQPLWLGTAAYAGVEHPAGVNQGAGDRMRLVQMPGTVIAPGAEWESRPFVIGGQAGLPVDEAFRAYIRDLRPRPADRRTVYSALGWYDFTNPADPLPELTEGLLAENLRQLDELRDRGASFDVYMLDDWWEPTDLSSFRRAAFPAGEEPVGAAIRARGMEPGLWWATTRALWSSGGAPGIEASYANDPAFGGDVALAGGEWRWLEEFGNLFIGERRLCLAAEPYRSMFQAAIPAHVERLGIALLKLDCVVLHCTSSSHEHRPGRHSVEPMIEALEDMLERCRAARPDLRVVWYWGFRSPWYLGLGDMAFDKGLLMEAATPSSAPFPTARQAMSLNVDQSIEHATSMPIELQDSLGVWVGDVAWCNRMGRDEWREAYVLDASRGSDLVQLWGDLTLLDVGDATFLAAVHRWIRRAGRAGGSTVRVGGSAWGAEPYGYARPADGGVLLTLVNPGWAAATYAIEPSLPGYPAGPREVLELYPDPGAVDRGDVVELAPFEVRVLAIVPAGRARAVLPDRRRIAVRSTRVVDPGALGTLVGAPPGEPRTASGTLRLPAVELGDVLYVTHRFVRDGEWRYDPEPQARLGFEATLDGLAVHHETTPRQRDRNGPGSAWVVRRIRVGPAWSDRDLRVVLSADLPAGVEVRTEARIVDAWWLRTERRFDDLLDVDGGAA